MIESTARVKAAADRAGRSFAMFELGARHGHPAVVLRIHARNVARAADELADALSELTDGGTRMGDLEPFDVVRDCSEPSGEGLADVHWLGDRVSSDRP